ncbi:hypothetical protein CHS0354_037375, partial [Potamilus streckersoni]
MTKKPDTSISALTAVAKSTGTSETAGDTSSSPGVQNWPLSSSTLDTTVATAMQTHPHGQQGANNTKKLHHTKKN